MSTVTEKTESMSLRVGPEDKRKFKEIVDNYGFSQKEAMQRFIAAFEAQADHERLSGSKEQLDAFDGYVSSLQHLFYSAIDAKHTAMDSAYLAVEKEMKSRDVIISEYQKRIEEAERKCEAAYVEKAAAEQSVKQFEKMVSENDARIKDLQKSLDDKDALISTLQNAGRKAAEYDRISDELADASKMIVELRAEMDKKDIEYQRKILEFERQKIAEYQKQYKLVLDGAHMAGAETDTVSKAKAGRRSKAKQVLENPDQVAAIESR